MPKIKKIMTTPLAEEEVEKLDYSRLASRNIKWYGCSEKWSGSFLQNNTCNTTTIWPSNCTPGYLFQRNENVSSYIFIEALLIRAKNWSQPRSFNWWMVKQTVAHPNHGILCSNKKEHHWYIHRPDWIFRALCWVDKANPQGLHTVWFYSCCFLVAQSCLTLCDRMDCSPPGSSVCGIFQTRILEWVAISYSRGSS